MKLNVVFFYILTVRDRSINR